MASENIIQSPNDLKSYRYIKLLNGIQTVLISEMHCNYVTNEGSMEKKLHEFNRNVLGFDAELEPNCKRARSNPKSSNDDISHRNGCDCKDVVAGVCLSVGAGSYHETGEVEGLAHLTEHMVFGGSKKYRGAKVFDEFLLKNGGLIPNGETLGNETCFAFGICIEQLDQALEMFSELFINPDMTIEYLENERKAVDSEFKEKKCALIQRSVFLQQLGTKGHPSTRFTWGNSETLHTKDGRDQTLLKLVEKFRELNYLPQRMILTIHASETLDKLEEVARYYFERIKGSKSNLLGLNTLRATLPYNNAEFKQLYYIHTDEPMQMHLAWELPIKPCEVDSVKPLHYLSRAISKPDKGGLANYLKERNLAYEIHCKPGSSDYDSYENFTFFHITFVLLRDTDTNMKEILRALFSYIKFLTNEKPKFWFFQEQQYIDSLEFHFLNEDHVIENSQTIARNVRRYGYENSLIGPILATKYDSKLIEEVTQLLVPENVNIICATDLSEDEKGTIRIEPYFKTPYIKSRIAVKFLKELQNINPGGDQFRFFEKNAYLTKQFESKYTEDEKDVPEPIGGGENEDKRVVMFHQFNKGERVEYHFLFRSPFPGSALQWEALFGIWDRVLKRNFISNFGGALEAHLEIKSRAIPTFGFIVSASGFFENLNKLAVAILDQIALMENFSNQDMFEACKFCAMQDYEVRMSDPSMLANDLFQTLTFHKHWSILQLYKTLQATEYPQFQEFCKKFVQSFFIVGLADGNISFEEAEEIRNHTLEKFNLKQNNWLNVPATVPTLELPLGETIIRARSFGKSNKNAIYTYYQIPDTSLKSKAICKILEKMMEAPAFEYFRNVHSLCYNVQVCSLTETQSAIYLVFKIGSDSKKFTGNNIQAIVDRFVKCFYTCKIVNLEAKILCGTKEFIQPEPMTPKNKFKRIIKNDMDFETFKKEEKAIDRIKRPELRKWYQQYLLPTAEKNEKESRMRKLCVQVVGKVDNEYPLAKKQPDFPGKTTSRTKDPTCQDETYHLILLSPKDPKKSENVVQDIEAFLDKLCGLPIGEFRHYIP